MVTGPGDLSGTMGLRGQGGHPDVIAAVRRVLQAAIDRGIPAGHSVGYEPDAVRPFIDMGISWISVDGDWITLFKHAKRVAGELIAMR